MLKFNPMERKKYFLVVAGGSGSRMGADCPKQFLPLAGRPVLQFTLERIMELVPNARIIVVLPREHVEFWKKHCLEVGFDCPQTIVAGGMTRFHSVRNGLEKIPDGALVAVHDAVRPFLTGTLLEDLFRHSEECPALVPAVPLVDTLKSLSGKKIDRNDILACQTPQLFHSEVLKKAYSLPFDTSFTDDASVAESAGIRVEYTKGERSNIKLTTPEDMVIAGAIISVLSL